jgi:hypothetical protein
VDEGSVGMSALRSFIRGAALEQPVPTPEESIGRKTWLALAISPQEPHYL